MHFVREATSKIRETLFQQHLAGGEFQLRGSYVPAADSLMSKSPEVISHSPSGSTQGQ